MLSPILFSRTLVWYKIQRCLFCFISVQLDLISTLFANTYLCTVCRFVGVFASHVMLLRHRSLHRSLANVEVIIAFGSSGYIDTLRCESRKIVHDLSV